MIESNEPSNKILKKLEHEAKMKDYALLKDAIPSKDRPSQSSADQGSGLILSRTSFLDSRTIQIEDIVSN